MVRSISISYWVSLRYEVLCNNNIIINHAFSQKVLYPFGKSAFTISDPRSHILIIHNPEPINSNAILFDSKDFWSNPHSPLSSPYRLRRDDRNDHSLSRMNHHITTICGQGIERGAIGRISGFAEDRVHIVFWPVQVSSEFEKLLHSC